MDLLHVGAGDDGHPVLLLAHEGVVGDEQTVLQHLLHHRVASAVDLDGAGLVHIWATVVVVDRHGGEGAQGVGLRHSGCRSLDAGGLGGDILPQLGEQLVFQRHRPVGGGEDLMLQVLQLLGDVPLAVHQGLLADVGIRHLVLEGVGNLNIIAKNFIITDL